jgi:hypothetical protein
MIYIPGDRFLWSICQHTCGLKQKGTTNFETLACGVLKSFVENHATNQA